MKIDFFKAKWKKTLEESSFIRFYFWKYRKTLLIGLGALIVCDILEVLPPLLLKDTIDHVASGGDARGLVRLAFIYFGILSIQAICRYLWRMFLVRSSMLSGRDLRHEFAQKLFRLPCSFYDKKKIGDLMALGTSDIEAVRMSLGSGLIVFADAIFYLITIPIAMFWLSPQLALIALIPLPIVPFLVYRNEREINKRFQAVQGAFGQLAAMAQENLMGIRVVKACSIEDGAVTRFRKAGEEFVRLNMRLSRVQTAFGPILDFTISIGLILLMYIGGKLTMDGAISIGTLVAFQRYVQKLVWPMAALGVAIGHYQKAVASSDRLKEVFRKLDEDHSKAATHRKAPGSIEIRGLSFSYDQQRPVLSNINITISPGKRVALVGAIGSGKTTLIHLLLRLYPVPDRTIFVGGRDINEWNLKELRNQFGYVAQDVFLFSDTIAENIKFGTSEKEMNADELSHFANLASIQSEIEGFPEKYHTRLGEKGINISGGQKQRLSIARALSKDPSIMLFDDAFSSVDTQTERKIHKALRQRAYPCTEIYAAHRISTIQDCDWIYVFDQGEIVQAGTHESLISDRNGLYFRFFEQQKSEDETQDYLEKIKRDLPFSPMEVSAPS